MANPGTESLIQKAFETAGTVSVPLPVGRCFQITCYMFYTIAVIDFLFLLFKLLND